ncbi:hypothetical protein [Nonomuraea bangladeshensis]|uniref:hypothetical protein n=1 Tax=Nonomuraea bangladeshensis TaxID=404385 RepID=UPI003C2B3832
MLTDQGMDQDSPLSCLLVGRPTLLPHRGPAALQLTLLAISVMFEITSNQAWSKPWNT